MKHLKIKLPHHSYQISIGQNEWKQLTVVCKKFCHENQIFIVTHPQLKKLYYKKIEAALGKTFQIHWLTFAAGEQNKTLSTVEKLATELTKKGANRKSLLVAFGGGVVGDVTGFLASIYMRGIRCIHVPTTLLSQVDSSVGGKTGVDLTTGKNLIGRFFQPEAVVILTDVLKTLPKREFACGMAEVIKYGLIWDARFFHELLKNSKKIQKHDNKLLQKMIYRCCEIKAAVVEKDETEQNLRAILNFGHSFGHAFELIGGYKKLKHGEAVAFGMVVAARLSHLWKVSPVDHTESVIEILKAYNLPVKTPKHSSSVIKKALASDKKSSGQTIRFVLLNEIGRVQVLPKPLEQVINGYKATQN